MLSGGGTYRVEDLLKSDMGSWDPAYDTNLRKQKKELHLFPQYTEQMAGVGKASITAADICVLE